jgi:hypothetical protein
MILNAHWRSVAAKVDAETPMGQAPNYECRSRTGCAAPIIGGRSQGNPLAGIYADGKILRGEVLIACYRFSATPNCGEALAQLRGINHIGPHGYGIQLTFREANRWERLKYWYKGHGVVPVYFWADDPDYAGAERYGTIRLHANRASTTVNHELGHALGLGHNTADATSVMHPGAVPGRLPYPSEQDVRTLIDFYRRRGLVAK